MLKWKKSSISSPEVANTRVIHQPEGITVNKAVAEKKFERDENDTRIRKYPNRRLYCPVENRYITVGDVAKRVKGRRDVETVDWVTGEDITKSVLLDAAHRLEFSVVDTFTESELIERIRSSPGEIEIREVYQRRAKRAAA
jgi:hypothetical protein